MIERITKFTILLMAVMFSLLAFIVSPSDARAEIERSTVEELKTSKYDIDRAKDWGLTKNEWNRYVEIMRGPRGLWSPDLDPIHVLGIEARTEQEKRKYAEMARAQEEKRVAKELAFQKAYDQAWFRYMQKTGMKPIDVDRIRNRKKTRRDITEPGDRLTIVTKLDCSSCDGVVRKLVANASESKGEPVDIYLYGTDTNKNAEIRKWAKSIGISTELVKDRKVTINHDKGTSKSLKLTESNLPTIFLRKMKSGRFEKVTLLQLGL